MPDRPTIRIFISSPSDVRPERLKAEQIVARLDREFAYHFRVEAVLWEREPLVASQHPQGNILMPHDTFPGQLSHKEVTGTEWEFEDALAAARAQGGIPELLLYRRTTKPVAELDDRKVLEERMVQLDLVDDFMGRWFRSADQKSVI